MAVVSVIIPVHGRFEGSQRAIDSVLAQEYRPIEIIIVDDASPTPFSPMIRNDSDDVRVKSVRLGKNMGPGGAREAGRKLATGSFVAYLDSDDHWSSKFLTASVSKMKANPLAGMTYCTARYTEKGAVREIVKKSWHSFDQILPYILWTRPWHTSSCLWRREVVDRVGEWLPLWAWEDYEYDCRAGCLEIQVAHIPETLCFIQWDAPGRVSVSRTKRRRKVLCRAKAVLSMHKNITATRWRSIGLAREQLSRMLISTAAIAADFGLKRLAWECFFKGWKLSSAKYRFCLSLILIPAVLFIRDWEISARLIRRVRDRLPIMELPVPSQ